MESNSCNVLNKITQNTFLLQFVLPRNCLPRKFIKTTQKNTLCFNVEQNEVLGSGNYKRAFHIPQHLEVPSPTCGTWDCFSLHRNVVPAHKCPWDSLIHSFFFLVGDVNSGCGCACMEANLCTFPQFCCEPKTALKTI